MITVALWTQFPESYINEKIIPKLLKHGINVSHILTPKTKSEDLSDTQAILFMKDKAGHKDLQKLRSWCEVYEKKMFCISRKESTWTVVMDLVRKNLEPKEVKPK